MDYIEKIRKITINIKKIYNDLIEMERIGLSNSSKYYEKIELLKLYKEVEDSYYQKLASRYDNGQLEKIVKKFNVDDTADISCDVLDISIEEVIKEQPDRIVSRRIVDKINDIIINRSDCDILLNALLITSQLSGIIDKSKNILIINDKEFFIANRSKALYEIADSASDVLYLRYILFIQLYIVSEINKPAFLMNKYNMIFLMPYIENKMIECNFHIDLDFFKLTIRNYSSKNNQEIYDYILKSECSNEVMEIIDEILKYDDSDFSNHLNLFSLNAYEALIRAGSLAIDDEVKDEIKYELHNIDNEKNKNLRKRLIRVIEQTKKDKEQLSI